MLKRLKLNKRWPNNMFISEDKLNPTNQFCGIELGSTMISKTFRQKKIKKIRIMNKKIIITDFFY